MIGVYIPFLQGTFYMPILQTIDRELRAAGLHMVVAFGVGDGNPREQTIDGISFLIERGCDGLIVMSSALLEEDIDALGSKKANLVVLNHMYKNIAQQCFTADHDLGGRMAAKALLQYKHTKIAVIAGPTKWLSGRISCGRCASQILGLLQSLGLLLKVGPFCPLD